MVKKLPVWKKTVLGTHQTKGEAEKFAIKRRAKALKSGQKVRYEVDYDNTTGGFKVTEFFWAADDKGRLL
jgi:hypothetical protein